MFRRGCWWTPGTIFLITQSFQLKLQSISSRWFLFGFAMVVTFRIGFVVVSCLLVLARVWSCLLVFARIAVCQCLLAWWCMIIRSPGRGRASQGKLRLFHFYMHNVPSQKQTLFNQTDVVWGYVLLALVASCTDVALSKSVAICNGGWSAACYFLIDCCKVFDVTEHTWASTSKSDHCCHPYIEVHRLNIVPWLLIFLLGIAANKYLLRGRRLVGTLFVPYMVWTFYAATEYFIIWVLCCGSCRHTLGFEHCLTWAGWYTNLKTIPRSRTALNTLATRKHNLWTCTENHWVASHSEV